MSTYPETNNKSLTGMTSARTRRRASRNTRHTATTHTDGANRLTGRIIRLDTSLDAVTVILDRRRGAVALGTF
jgi:hypothetical protein